MPREQKCCCKQVKEVIKNSSRHQHRSCNTTKKTTVIRGKILNGYFECNRFRRDTDYAVCRNIKDKIGDYEPPPQRKINNKRKVSGRDHNTRNSPVEINVPEIRLDLEKLKHVQLKVLDMLELPVINLLRKTFELDQKQFENPISNAFKKNTVNRIPIAVIGFIEKKRKHSVMT